MVPVASLTRLPARHRLFHNAILHSDPFGIPFRNLQDAQAMGHLLAQQLGCDNSTVRPCVHVPSLARAC